MSERAKDITTVLLAVLLGVLAVWASLSSGKTAAREKQDVARCKSLGGEYASGKCYINGEER